MDVHQPQSKWQRIILAPAMQCDAPRFHHEALPTLISLHMHRFLVCAIGLRERQKVSGKGKAYASVFIKRIQKPSAQHHIHLHDALHNARSFS